MNSTMKKLLGATLGLMSTGAIATTTQLSIQPLESSSFRLDWEGKTGITYFIQWSLNLQEWNYFPVIEEGVEHDAFNFNSDAPYFFTRLVTSDISTTDPYSADFDDDGLSNIFEVTYGYDPFEQESTLDGPDASLDPDTDGLSNASEQAAGSDPRTKDNPILNLEVTVE